MHIMTDQKAVGEVDHSNSDQNPTYQFNLTHFQKRKETQQQNTQFILSLFLVFVCFWNANQTKTNPSLRN